MTEEHGLSLRNRQQMSLNGVISVESFDEKEIWVDTKLGSLILKGQGMHITQLDLTDGKLTVDGLINALEYRDDRGGRGGRSRNFVERLLR
ncbi:MAG: sporulation protein YabP [Bacillota bacterium]|jgi:sporulation protein YabP